MNIWLPIITNLIVLGILVVGVLSGRKNGWRLELGKLFFSAGALVGTYFLTPVLYNKLITIEKINALFSGATQLFSSCIFLLTFVIFFSIISLTTFIIRKHINHYTLGINTVKPAKVKGINKKETRQLKKEQKKIIKEQMKEFRPKTVSRVFGVIFGLILAVLVGYVVMIPTKFLFKEIVEQKPELKQIETGYEYTIYGQFDKVLDVSDFITKQ